MRKNKPYSVAIVGLGQVGQGLVERLRLMPEFKIAALCASHQKPWVKLIDAPFYTDYATLIARQDIDIIVEVMGGVANANQVISSALSAGKHVISANATLMASHGENLQKIARVNNVNLSMNSAAMGAVQINNILGGISQPVREMQVNLSVNFNRIIRRMELFNENFETALATVEKSGEIDISGKEDFYRLALLRQMLYGKWSNVSSPHSLKLDRLQAEDLSLVAQMGGVVRVVGKVTQGKITLQPTVLAENHPFASLGPQESIVLKLEHGEMNFTLPIRSANTLVDTIINDLYLIKNRNFTQTIACKNFPQSGQGTHFARLPLAERQRLRQDIRFTVGKEMPNIKHGKVGAFITTGLDSYQLQEILGTEAIVMPVMGKIETLASPALQTVS